MYGPIHSLHEGYAVLLEELEEAEYEIIDAKNLIKSVWLDIKSNETETSKIEFATILATALDAACESIQVAAVCKRIIDFCEEKEHAKE